MRLDSVSGEVSTRWMILSSAAAMAVARARSPLSELSSIVTGLQLLKSSWFERTTRFMGPSWMSSFFRTSEELSSAGSLVSWIGGVLWAVIGLVDTARFPFAIGDVPGVNLRLGEDL